MPIPSTVLSVQQLSAFYGRAQALWGVTFDLPEGMGLGVIGLNGAGKSTLLRSVTRVHRAVTGEITFRDKSIMSASPHTIARLGVSFVREGAPVFTDLTVEGHLEMGAELARRRGGEGMPLTDLMEIFPRLDPLLRRRAGLLSGGQRQMVALATAVISRPRFIVLDEPSAGLSPEAAATITQALRDLRGTGMSVLIAEQNEDWLEGVASHVLVLERGRLVVQEGQSSPIRELSSKSPDKRPAMRSVSSSERPPSGDKPVAARQGSEGVDG